MNIRLDAKPAACFFAMILMSQIFENLCLFCLKYSRKILLNLFRTAAFPTFFVTVTPMRDLSW
jgi:hypothetical protein